jgi:hypothetical protein
MGIKDVFNKIKKEKKILEGEESRNTSYSSQQDFPDRATALQEFERSKQKLFDVNKWSDMPGLTSRFVLYNARGQQKTDNKPALGDFLLIDLPGPTPENWVKVTDIKVEEELAEFTVSPSPDPRSTGEERKEVEHFFADQATSTFRVHLKGKSIFAHEIGRNEEINNEGKEAGNREVINTLIAEGGWAGFQALQWEKLTDYLVHNTELDK